MNQLSEQTPTVAIDQKENTAPRQVFLFSGHMVDAPDRSPPRFPPDKEPLAAAAIAKLLDELGAGATDVAISSGACGGDLLFVESCLQTQIARGNLLAIRGRGVPQRVHQLRRRTLAAEVFLGQGARPVLAHNAARAGAYAHWRRLLCLRQPVDARSSARLRNQKSHFYLPLGSPSG